MKKEHGDSDPFHLYLMARIDRLEKVVYVVVALAAANLVGVHVLDPLHLLP